jgi:type I restriction enzyme S subunit
MCRSSIFCFNFFQTPSIINGIFKHRHEFGSGIPIVNVYDLYQGMAVDLSKVERVEVSEQDFQRYQIISGDLLFCRSSLKKEGIGWCCYVPENSEAAVFDCHIMRIRPNIEEVIPEFIAYYWSHPDVRAKIIENSRTSTMTTMNQQDLSNVDVLLPSLPEQKRIVAILNEQMSAVEKARAAAEVQLQAAKTLPAAYLREIFDSPEAQKWERKLLGEVANLERGKFTPRPRNDPRYYDGTYPWIQTGEIERCGKYIKTYGKTLNEHGLAVSKLFPKGTLVMTIAANIGAVGILTFDSCMPDSLVGITPLPEIGDTEFFYYFLLHVREYIQSTAPQSAQANLKLSLLNPIQIPLPSLSIQKELALKLSAKIEQAENLQRSLQDQLNTIKQLPAALLRQAFNGEL